MITIYRKVEVNSEKDHELFTTWNQCNNRAEVTQIIMQLRAFFHGYHIKISVKDGLSNRLFYEAKRGRVLVE